VQGDGESQHPHWLLGVVPTVTEGHVCRRGPLQVLEHGDDAASPSVKEDPIDRHDEGDAAQEAERRRGDDGHQRLREPLPLNDPRTGGCHASPDQATDQPVSFADWDAEPVGQQAPGHGAEEGGDDGSQR
jgi:hypothetical protein